MLRRLSIAGVLALSVTTSLFVGCDPPANHDDPAGAAGDDDLLFRTTYGSGSGANPPVYGNTSALGDHAVNELDLTHEPHDGHVFQHVHLWDREVVERGLRRRPVSIVDDLLEARTS